MMTGRMNHEEYITKWLNELSPGHLELVFRFTRALRQEKSNYKGMIIEQLDTLTEDQLQDLFDTICLRKNRNGGLQDGL